MKIAAFNVENLFDRAKALNLPDEEETQAILKDEAELASLMEESNYTDLRKSRMIELIKALGLERTDNGKQVILRRVRGKFLKRPRNAPIEIVADGRDDWVGWTELKTASVNETAILNTGQVIRDIDVDLLAVIEAEDRVALKKFGETILTEVGGESFPQVMLIDGNDDRGIDVGLMAKNGYEIGTMRSHIHDLNAQGRPIFSRDCPEFSVTTPTGETIWILPNHYKSKFGGDTQYSRNRRKNQAKRTAEIYEELRNQGHENIVVLGDLNDKPQSSPLRPLLTDTDLKDVSEHPRFDTGEFEGIGTYGLGNDNDKIDYLLLSPALWERVDTAGLFRKGAWPGSRPVRWPVYPELRKKIHAASDHHVIWAEIEI